MMITQSKRKKIKKKITKTAEKLVQLNLIKKSIKIIMK